MTTEDIITAVRERLSALRSTVLRRIIRAACEAMPRNATNEAVRAAAAPVIVLPAPPPNETPAQQREREAGNARWIARLAATCAEASVPPVFAPSPARARPKLCLVPPLPIDDEIA